MGTETTPTHSWRLVTRCLLLKLRPSEKLVLQALAFHYSRDSTDGHGGDAQGPRAGSHDSVSNIPNEPTGESAADR
jgi:hypothetical protein